MQTEILFRAHRKICVPALTGEHLMALGELGLGKDTNTQARPGPHNNLDSIWVNGGPVEVDDVSLFEEADAAKEVIN